MTIRDRIQDFRWVPARERLDNDGNPHTHPLAKRDALRRLPEKSGGIGVPREPSPARVSPTLAHVAFPAVGWTVFPTPRGHAA
jgi:hypothetical protein